MLKQSEYNLELEKICMDMKKSFAIKSGFFSALATKKCIKRIIKLNSKTKNQNIDFLIYALGRTKLEYKKYCVENNYYTDPIVNKMIKEAYIKLARKAMKIQTKKSYVDSMRDMVEINYDSARGSYLYKNIVDNKVVKTTEYSIDNVDDLDLKREDAMERLKQLNFGIDVVDELGINPKRLRKINPDIVTVLVNEGKIKHAKMYIKEVATGIKLNKPLKITYILDKDSKNGKFGPKDNKRMKKMAKADSVASEIKVVTKEKTKGIIKPKLTWLSRIIIKKLRKTEPELANYIDSIPDIKEKDIKRKTTNSDKQATIKALKNTNTGKIVAYEAVENDLDVKSLLSTKSGKVAAYANNKLKTASKKLVNTNTGKIVAYERIENKKLIKGIVNTNTGKISAYGNANTVKESVYTNAGNDFRKSLRVSSNVDTGRITAYSNIENNRNTRRKGFVNTNTGKIVAYGAR